MRSSTGSAVAAHLERERALPGGGRPGDELEEFGDRVQPAEASESGGGEHHGVQVVGVDPAEPRVDVPAEVDDLEVRPQRLQLRDPARRAGADAGALAGASQSSALARAQRVAGIGPARDGADAQLLGTGRSADP